MTGEGYKREEGLALVSVLWALSILSLIAAIVLSSSSLSYRVERNTWKKTEARVISDAVLVQAVLSLLDNRAEYRWSADGVAKNFAFKGATTNVVIEDELGKIDINNADSGLLRGLFLSVAVGDSEADSLVNVILDWRESAAAKRLHAAENIGGPNARAGYRPRERAFQSVSELRLVRGMTDDLFVKIEPALTVYSQRPTVDPQYASAMVLRALPSMDEQKVTDALSARKGEADRVDASSAGGFDPARQLSGRVFSIKIEVENSQRLNTERAVIRLTGNPAQPYWLLALNDGN